MDGRNTLTVDLIVYNLKAKDLGIKIYDKSSLSDGLFVRGRSEKRNKRHTGKSKNRSTSKSKKNGGCYFYKKMGYYRNESPLKKG